MKKCPNCQKTFDDNMKFCQADGTPLVVVADNQPKEDPYATVVAKKDDLEIPKEEPKLEPEAKPDPFKTVVTPTSTQDSQKSSDDEDLLEIPADDKDEDVDPLKTMVVSGNTADNIRVNIPDEKPKKEEDPLLETEEKPKKDDPSEAATMISPEIPKFSEPEIAPPSFGETPPPKETPKTSLPAQEEPKQVQEEPKPTPPSSPFDSSKPKEPKQTPIPSPFDDSMPPGYAPPSTPPFEPPKEPMKPTPLNVEKKEEPAQTPFADPNTPVVESDTEGWGSPSSPLVGADNQELEQNNQFDTPIQTDSATGSDGPNQTLAFVSLGLGIASIICALGFVGGIPAIFVGLKARKNEKENPAEYGGSTLALIGIILGIAGTLISLLAIIAWVVLFFVFN